MLRQEKRFESLDALREQIGIDAENARRFFAAAEEVGEGP
jgi:FAD synthase